MNHRLIAAAIFLVIGIFLQLSIGGATGVWFNFSLAALVTGAFFMGFPELLLLVLLAVFILNWQPAPSLEMVLYAALPFLVLWLRGSLRMKPWLGNLVALFFCFLLFYLVIDARFLFTAPAVFVKDLAGGLVFGAISFRVLDSIGQI